MIIFIPRSLAFALLIAALPVGFALAGAGGRGGAIGGGEGAAGRGGGAGGGGGVGGCEGPPPIADLPGGISPGGLSKQRESTKDPTVPKGVQGIAEQAPFSPTGLARPGPDGVSTVIVAARPCGVAAHETDGTTTCIGIPEESARAKKRR